MNLMDYVRVLWRRGWILLLLAALAAGGAYYLSKIQTPIYRSTQKVLIQPSRNDFGLTQTTNNLLYPYVEYLDSELIAEKVINSLKLDLTPSDLKSNVYIAPDQLRMTIQIDVDSTDGEVANRIARAWGDELVLWRQQQNQELRREDQINAQLQDNPRYTLDRPRPLVNAAAGGILGLLLGGVIVFVLEYLENSIVRRRDDVERAIEVPVLATIPLDL